MGAQPVGDGCFMWEPNPWAMGVAHPLKTIARRVGLLQKSDPLHVVQDFKRPDQKSVDPASSVG